MMHDCGFAQTVNFPTRNDSILDLFFMNRPTLVQECYSAPGNSDHEIVVVTLEPQAFVQPNRQLQNLPMEQSQFF